MFENEIIVPIDEELSTEYLKSQYEEGRYQFYWNQTGKEKYLRLYQQSLKNRYIIFAKLLNKEMKDLLGNKKFQINLNDNTLLFKLNKGEE